MQDYPMLYLSTLNTSKSRETTRRLINRLPNYNEGQAIDWTKLTPIQVMQIIANLEKFELAPATVNATLSVIKGIAHQAWLDRQLNSDDFTRIKNIKHRKNKALPKGREIKFEEINALFETCRQENNATLGARDALMIALGIYVGLRRSEIANLKIKNIDMENMRLSVFGKGNKEEMLPLPDHIKPLLESWLHIRMQHILDYHLTGMFLFGAVNKAGKLSHLNGISDQAIYNMLKIRSQKAGIELDHLPSPHDMRRTKITNLLDANVNPRIVQRLARHANVETTMRYDRGDIEGILRDSTNL